jgi:hypothetical protein
VHIPKTAGTSLIAEIKAGKLGRYLLDDLDRPATIKLRYKLRRLGSRLAARVQAKRLLRDYDVIHGHFLVSKYAFLYPRADFITFMRDPVSRTLSTYFHLKRVGSAASDLKRQAPRMRMIVAGDLSLVDFARDPHMVHLYRNYTRGLALEDFRLIGITERYAESLAVLNAMCGSDVVPAHERRGDYQRFEAEYRRWLPDIQRANEENMDIYQRALGLFERRMKGASARGGGA